MKRRGGFTLIEVLAAVFLTAVVMSVAISFFVGLSDATDAAAAKTRRGRQALAVIDRIGRDVEAAYLRVAPQDRDPLTHPWFFVALNQEGEPAADRIQFNTRNNRPRNRLGHGSDLGLVTWLLRPAVAGPGYELLRAVEPGLPRTPPGEFLPDDDERFMVVAENIEHFGLRFLGEENEWVDEWDSSQLERSGQLPLAAEIELAFLPEIPDELEDFDDFGSLTSERETDYYARHVLIPMRPVDVDAMLQEAIEQAAAEEQETEVDATEEEMQELLERAGASGGARGSTNDEDYDSRGR